MRLFIGIPLAPAVIEELAILTGRLKSPDDGLRWSAQAGWHITLQFLGSTTAQQFACVTSQLRQIRYAPFEIQLEPPGFFDRVGVFFAGVQLSTELSKLQQRVLAVTTPCGFAPEDRPYHPHITLAREKSGRQGLRKLRNRIAVAPGFSTFRASEFSLYESFPGPGGSKYEVRERFELQSD